MRKLTLIISTILVAAFIIGCGGGDKGLTEQQDRAAKLFEDGDYDGAAIVYEHIYLNYPDSEAADEAMDGRKKSIAMSKLEEAQDLANRGREEEVKRLLLDAAEVFPDDVSINYGIGWIYFKIAERVLDQAMQYPPYMQPQIMLQAGAYMDLAKVRFERCIELDEEDFHGYKGMTIFHVTDGDIEKAMENVDNAIEKAVKDSDVIEMRSLKTQIYIQDNEMDKAKEEVDSLAVEYPENGEVYYIIAQYYISQDEPDSDKAIEALRSGVKKDFDDESVRGKMYALISLMLDEKKEYTEARDMMLKALEIDPAHPEYLGTYPVIFADYKIEELKNKDKEEKEEKEE
ncbi:MAG: hypothetical protein GY771_05525 [bacterium]|nr:hypothetical protein [bacterium]